MIPVLLFIKLKVTTFKIPLKMSLLVWTNDLKASTYTKFWQNKLMTKLYLLFWFHQIVSYGIFYLGKFNRQQKSEILLSLLSFSIDSKDFQILTYTVCNTRHKRDLHMLNADLSSCQKFVHYTRIKLFNTLPYKAKT